VKVPRTSSIVAAVKAKVAALEARQPGASEWPLAALALSLAGMVADKASPVSSRATAARELRATLAELDELLPAEPLGDGVDGLADGVQAKLRVVS
jgi:hypothetical protein